MILEKIDSKTGDGGRKRSKGEAGTLGVKWYGKERETGDNQNETCMRTTYENLLLRKLIEKIKLNINASVQALI